ncbi:MAG: hypothetical protein ACOYL8_01125 [Patescibacteria group bacterium]
MTKETELIPVTRKTYEIMLKKENELNELIGDGQKEKALENENRNENLQDSTAEFHEDLKVYRSRREDLKKDLEKIEVIQPEPQNKIVKIGNAVVLRTKTNEVATRILDGLSYSKNVCSLKSALGNLIYGKKVGDIVSLNNKEYTIQEILLPEF